MQQAKLANNCTNCKRKTNTDYRSHSNIMLDLMMAGYYYTIALI